jgi:hypothetical protein
MNFDFKIFVTGSSIFFLYIYNKLAGITLKPRHRILGILGHSLGNKIPLVDNQEDSEMDSMEG